MCEYMNIWIYEYMNIWIYEYMNILFNLYTYGIPTRQVLVLELFQFAQRSSFAGFPEEQNSSVGGGKICEAGNTIQVGKKWTKTPSDSNIGNGGFNLKNI